MPDMSASASLAMTHVVTFAQEVDEDKVTPGVLGFIVFAAMALAVWALMKSMSKHMNKVDFKETPDDAAVGDGTSEKETAAQGTAGRSTTEGPSGKPAPGKG
ncbi:hypothetical protein [Streptomyces griseorubiginosus]|uniref:hypothetical protein n=1 Tax=Streptomyces griseorubiginosus TaxID=67304 RepID=UPI002E80180B|nr:hypothetical protein [Streptomyces griseorubiginosus]WUB44655.1 hypothetical protein OHN19_15420 [Streptomyces griseorubiginosus]WUB53172.1 hypothetical protein OG942_15415 [Streptomyces griseorubiginosus]